MARVSVDLAAETRANVLAAPITALVARPGGGYAVVVGTMIMTFAVTMERWIQSGMS